RFMISLTVSVIPVPIFEGIPGVSSCWAQITGEMSSKYNTAIRRNNCGSNAARADFGDCPTLEALDTFCILSSDKFLKNCAHLTTATPLVLCFLCFFVLNLLLVCA